LFRAIAHAGQQAKQLFQGFIQPFEGMVIEANHGAPLYILAA
jgi:hypothetical protein